MLGLTDAFENINFPCLTVSSDKLRPTANWPAVFRPDSFPCAACCCACACSTSGSTACPPGGSRSLTTFWPGLPTWKPPGAPTARSQCLSEADVARVRGAPPGDVPEDLAQHAQELRRRIHAHRRLQIGFAQHLTQAATKLPVHADVHIGIHQVPHLGQVAAQGHHHVERTVHLSGFNQHPGRRGRGVFSDIPCAGSAVRRRHRHRTVSGPVGFDRILLHRFW